MITKLFVSDITPKLTDSLIIAKIDTVNAMIEHMNHPMGGKLIVFITLCSSFTSIPSNLMGQKKVSGTYIDD